MSTTKDAAEWLRSRKPIPKPVPAYLPSAGSPLTVSQPLYEAAQKAPRALVQDFIIPIRSGRAWKAPAGSIIRISTPEGPQVGESFFFLVVATPERLACLFAVNPIIILKHLGLKPRRLEHLERPQPARTILGESHQTAARLARNDARQTLVMSALHATVGHDTG